MRPCAPITTRVSSRKSHSSSRCPLMVFLVARTLSRSVRARTTSRIGMVTSRAITVTMTTGERALRPPTMRSKTPSIRSWTGRIPPGLLDVTEALQPFQDLLVVLRHRRRLAEGGLQGVLDELLHGAVAGRLRVFLAPLEQVTVERNFRSEHRLSSMARELGRPLEYGVPLHLARFGDAELGQDRGGQIGEGGPGCPGLAVAQQYPRHGLRGHGMVAAPLVGVVAEDIRGEGPQNGVPGHPVVARVPDDEVGGEGPRRPGEHVGGHVDSLHGATTRLRVADLAQLAGDLPDQPIVLAGRRHDARALAPPEVQVEPVETEAVRAGLAP